MALRENRREDDDLAPAGIGLRINRTITVSVSAGQKTCSRRSPLRHYVVFLSEDLQPFVLGEVAKEALLHLAQCVRILRNLIQTKLREECIRFSDPSLRTLESSTHAIQIPASPTFFFRVFRFPLLAVLGDILKSCAGSNSCSKLTEELWGVSCGHASQSA